MKKRIFFLITMVTMLILWTMDPYALVFGASDSGFVFPQYSKKVSLDFKNADLKDVVKAFCRQVSMNFLIAQDVDAKGITVSLTDVPIEEALEKILSAYGLAYEYDAANNLFFVKNKPKEGADTLVTRVYQLKFASVSGSAVGNELGKGGAISGGLSGSSGKGGGGGGASGGLVTALKTILKGKGASIIEDSRTNSLIITASQDSFSGVERLLARLDAPVPMVMIEVEMLDVSKVSSDQIGLTWRTGVAFSGGARSIRFPYDAQGDSGVIPTRGKLSFEGVGAVLEFLKGQDDTKSLARPRILTLDNQPASIRISTDEAIGESTTSENNNATSTRTAERTTTGVLMMVTPQVSLLTDEITLVVEPKVIDATKSVSFPSGNSYKNPEERGVKSILKAKNGETIIIGGLLRREETLNVSKLPFLGDLPFVGNAFKHTKLIKSDRELMIFITPRIMSSLGEDSKDLTQIVEGVSKGEQSNFDPREKSIFQEMDRISDK
ncbi:MAG: hypothetical protein HQL21_01305 [Candidatus Omnitrophica bacterium]|nr:hypothetical protein [Candidatus Omnitrophota bacterium]